MGAYRTGMKLERNADDPGVNVIRSYAAGEVRIGERLIRESCLVTAERIETGWTVRAVAELTVADLEPIFALRPQVVVLGTGPTQQFPSAAVRGAFAQRRIGLEVMDLGAACRTFNVLVQEGRNVAAALLLQ